MLKKILLLAATLMLAAGLVGCADGPDSEGTTVTSGASATTGAPVTTETPTTSTTTTGGATTTATTDRPTPSTTIIAPEDLQPIVAPTLPEVIPGYTEEDPATGLHMTGTPKEIDLGSYRLKVSGKVSTPLSLTYDELRLLPKMTATPTIVCPGFFKDTTWSGVPLTTLLDMAGVQPDAQRIKMLAADGYSIALKLEDALAPGNFLAYEWRGQPVPALHGFPLRAVFPDETGSFWVKWLLEIVVE